jgi:MoaA/NifB/PqqE/SkfB family radical SAM enzyme
MNMKLRDYATEQVIKNLVKILPKCSDKTFSRGAYLLEKVATDKHKDFIRRIKGFMGDGGSSRDFVKRILKETNPHCREKFAVNLIANGLVINSKKREDAYEAGSAVPTTILISPTMRCNLKCEGCYAFNYSKNDDLDLKVIDRVIKEAKDSGAAFFSMLGGEPFVKKEIFGIFKKHNDTYFQVFTNGTLINNSVAEKLAELGNVLVEISIEGFEKNTDARRGKGTFKKVMKAMDVLKNHGIPFGYSVCVTKKNAEEVFSDEFVDLMISKGAFIGWHFLYMPVCGDPDMKLMPTPEQRVHMLERGRKIRAEKPVFIIDFWNDAPYVGGCIAGKEYIHITSKGDVEPCIFTHFAVDNIKDKSLMEVMNSDYFKALRKNQPYNDNLFLPCQWIDNPKVSREMHKKFNLRPTHPGADDILKNKKLRTAIDRYSKGVKKAYAGIWAEEKAAEAADNA